MSPTITESPLEADFCYYLEFDKEVIKYEAQPLAYEYWYSGEGHFYTPDFEVLYNGFSCYYEIKFERDILRDKEFHSRFEAQKKAAVEQGKGLLLITDEYILKPNNYENLCLLYKFSKVDIDTDYLLSVIDVLKDKGELMISGMLRTEFRELDFQQIYKLIWDRVLVVDLESEILSVDSTIKLSDS